MYPLLNQAYAQNTGRVFLKSSPKCTNPCTPRAKHTPKCLPGSGGTQEWVKENTSLRGRTRKHVDGRVSMYPLSHVSLKTQIVPDVITQPNPFFLYSSTDTKVTAGVKGRVCLPSHTPLPSLARVASSVHVSLTIPVQTVLKCAFSALVKQPGNLYLSKNFFRSSTVSTVSPGYWDRLAHRQPVQLYAPRLRFRQPAFLEDTWTTLRQDTPKVFPAPARPSFSSI